ncbi:HNH endonuclease signature motif containing protein [Leifsonia poae]|uniref:HNH endonuclease signature motif containing protein n=1 Tax=Leifsonia poae TaxID=110933 RepID=UPI0022F26834|nr:HNH endonuclease signature motif containing protein [Leifsonia poae]
MSVHHASVIVRELNKAAPSCSVDAIAEGERLLVEHAPDLSVEETRVLAAHVRDRLDEDGIEPREDRQRRRRSLTITTTADGMTHVDWYLDPESAASVVTAIDTLVGAQLRRVQFGDPGAGGAPGASGASGASFAASSVDALDELTEIPVTRSLAQIRSDEATEVFRHLASCSSPAAAGHPPVSIIVRIALDALVSGRGRGEIDGVEAPVSAATVRRMAADAKIIPVVLGGAGEVLDLGRSRRLFSRAQRLALAERDGGCAWSGCPHPPSYTEAHHIRWWDADAGPTDLDNGVLLCSRHHHRVHDDGWQIEVRRNVPYFIPPEHVDLSRRPRRGGRIALPERVA